MSYLLTASYAADSYWNLNFDLNEVADWFVKWDILHVKFNEDDEEYIEIEATNSASENLECFKHPLELEISEE